MKKVITRIKNRARILFYYLVSTRMAGWYFNMTKKKFLDDKTSRWGNAWWYGYLFHYAVRLDVDAVRDRHFPKRRVRTLMPDFDYFLFYNKNNSL